MVKERALTDGYCRATVYATVRRFVQRAALLDIKKTNANLLSATGDSRCRRHDDSVGWSGELTRIRSSTLSGKFSLSTSSFFIE